MKMKGKKENEKFPIFLSPAQLNSNFVDYFLVQNSYNSNKTKNSKN
jgi:hypothetical protein